MLIVLMILLSSPHSLPPVLPLFPRTTETLLIDTPLHCTAWETRTAWRTRSWGMWSKVCTGPNGMKHELRQ